MVTTLTRARIRIALTVEKTWFAGEASSAFLFRISILSLRGTLVPRVRVDIVDGLVWGVAIRRWRLGTGRVPCGQHSIYI